MSIETFVMPMREHRAKLDGDTGSATKAAESLATASSTLHEIDGQLDAAARTALSSWYGQQAGLFQDRTGNVKSAMTTLASNATAASTVAGTATSAITTGRTTIDGLITEFIAHATPLLEAAATATACGDDGRALQAYATVRRMADEYAMKSGEALAKVRGELAPLAGQLTGMTSVDIGTISGLGGQLGPPAEASTTTAGFTGGATTTESHGPTGPATASGPGGAPGPGGVLGAGGSSGAAATGSGSGGGGNTGGGGGGGSSTAVGPRLPTAIPPQPGDGVGVNLPDGTSSEAPNEIAAQAVRNAISALGTPYVWGASNPPAGTDCSGLTSWAYAGAGLELPRHSSAQAVGASVPDPSQLLPGDLVVWNGHVAMTVGPGQMIEAGDPVQINSVRTSNIGMPFLGFYRPTG
jgi:cell wall-associated NlpC family hydrolase